MGDYLQEIIHKLYGPLKEGDREDGVIKADTDFPLFSVESLGKKTSKQRFCAGSLLGSALWNPTCKRLRKAGLGTVMS